MRTNVRFPPIADISASSHTVELSAEHGGLVAEHNKLFMAVVLVGAVLAVNQLLFNGDGLAWGYGIIAVGLITLAGFLWSKRKRPDG